MYIVYMCGILRVHAVVVQTTLFEDGLEQLNSTFRELLKQHSKRVPDGTLIDIANASSEEGKYNCRYTNSPTTPSML